MKILEFKNNLQNQDINIAIFYNLSAMQTDPNFFYFSGYEGIGALIIPKTNQPFLLIPRMEYDRAKKHSRIKRLYLWDKKRLFENVKEILPKEKIKVKVIGVDYSNFTLSAFNALKNTFKGVKIKDVDSLCRKTRIIKTSEELNYIKKGCKITDKIFNGCMKNSKSLSTESDIASFLEYTTKKQGLDIAFKPIVASGKSSSIPHYTPEKIKLRKGFCVIDFGIKYKGYCTDMTRTIYIGKPSKFEIEIYRFLLKVQMEIINNVKLGVVCGELCAIANNSLGKYKKNFIHGLGHGVGIEIHEAPNLKLDSKDILEDNTAFTIEPGVYFPNKFGIRIEDTVALIDGKTEVLTKSRKEMIVI